VLRVEIFKVNLPLRTRFAVAKGSADVKTNFLVVLNNRYSGEAATSVYYGPTLDDLEKDLRTGARFIEQLGKVEHDTMEKIAALSIHPIARSALTGMIVNYLSGESARYPWEVLSLPTPVGIKSSFTIGIDDPTKMVSAIQSSEYPIVKVKLGGPEDAKVVESLKDVVGKEIRVDANGGWDLARAEEMIYYLAKSGVRIIEQPTEAKLVADWPRLKGKNDVVELIIDEGLESADDFDEVSSHVDGVNIKMEKSGGVLAALSIAAKAKESHKKVMLGCMVSSSIGIAQSVYMSSLADYVDLDGPQLLQNDIARGITFHREQIEVDREIIGGPTLIRDVLEQYIVS
jgi:L-alanine-DL-glutamate epimerase-like enolase superfamily enzyme